MSDEKNAEQTAKLDELFATETTDAARGSGRPARTTPRVRWAGIVWGLIFAAAGWFAAWTLLAQERRAAFSGWVLSLDGGGWAVVGALALGALLLVIGLSQALKAATRDRS